MVGIPMGEQTVPHYWLTWFLYSYENEFLDKLIKEGKRQKIRDTFGFHIVSFPFMSSNIPSAPAYGVYASQLIRYARCCSNYSDFLLRHRALVTGRLSQGCKFDRLSNTFAKFYDRHTDLVGSTREMSAKCLLILSVEMIFVFDGFADDQINKIS